MEHHATFFKSNIRYAKISLKKRQQLVMEVLEKNQLISKAAKKLNLKLSTAKLIVKRFKEEGSFFESKAERARRLKNRENAARKALNEAIPTPIQQKLQNPLTEHYSNSNPTSIIYPFFYDSYLMQVFPFTFPAFDSMMVYQL